MKIINEIYGSLEDWFKKNLLSLNIVKTHYMNFSTRKEVVRDIGKMGTIIETINYTRFLGLNIEYSITWERHIDDLIKKLCTACYNIRNMKSSVPQGSILGPLHFIVYINDLPEILKHVCLPILFADDASVMIAHTNSIEFKKTMRYMGRWKTGLKRTSCP
jgi:hypothetical protein